MPGRFQSSDESSNHPEMDIKKRPATKKVIEEKAKEKKDKKNHKKSRKGKSDDEDEDEEEEHDDQDRSRDHEDDEDSDPDSFTDLAGIDGLLDTSESRGGGSKTMKRPAASAKGGVKKKPAKKNEGEYQARYRFQAVLLHCLYRFSIIHGSAFAF